MTSVELDAVLQVDERFFALVFVAVENSQMFERVRSGLVLPEDFLDESLEFSNELLWTLPSDGVIQSHGARQLLELPVVQHRPVVARYLPCEQHRRLEKLAVREAIGVVQAVEAL